MDHKIDNQFGQQRMGLGINFEKLTLSPYLICNKGGQAIIVRGLNSRISFIANHTKQIYLFNDKILAEE
jgi:hypothetical protein